MKKLLSIFLALVLILSVMFCLPFTVSAETDSGKCGDYLTWSYDSGTATLTISGSGNMYHYSSENYRNSYVTTAPWRSYYNTMKTVVIGNSVTSIGDDAFFGCTGITSITIPNSVTSIGGYAFRDCTGLTSISIPNSVTGIGDDAFYNCTGLTSIEISDSVTSIGSWAFFYCTGLTSVTIPDSVTSIGSYAFYGCTGLTSITIPNSVTSIGDRAFDGCTGLTSITIPNSVTSIGNYAFYNCTGLTKIAVELDNVKYHSAGNCLIETETKTLILGCKTSIIPTDGSATSIGSYAFYNCTGLRSIEIPNSVTSIGDDAFYNCTGLTSIEISDSVTSIGNFAFCGCTGLESVTIGNSVTSIGYNAFDNCTGLTVYCYKNSYAETYCKNNSINYTSLICNHTHTEIRNTKPSTCTVKGYSGDTYCTDCGEFIASGSELPISDVHSFTETTVEPAHGEQGYTLHKCSNCNYEYKDNYSGIVGICGDNAKWCYYNGTLTIAGKGNISDYEIGKIGSDYVTTAPWGTYYKDITSIVIENGITEIGNNAFYGCSVVTSISLSNTLKNIGEAAFCRCSALTNATIPDSVISMGKSAFSNCTKLTEIILGEGITELEDNVFFSCTKLSSIIIPDGVVKIGYAAFSRCVALSEIELPATLETIGETAFANCITLTSITIPKSVTNIGNYAFSSCSKLIVRCYENTTAETYVKLNSIAYAIICEHKNTEIRNAKESTCSVKGYSGDTYCTDCNEKLYSGEELPLKEHILEISVVNPTSVNEGYTLHKCKYCDYEYKDNFIAKLKHGFINEDGKTKYYVEGVAVSGWQEIDNNKYYFSKTTYNMVTGVKFINEKLYSFAADGKLIGTLTDFVTESGKTKYYKDGIAQTGWQEINSKTYYFSKITQNMITGEREIGGKLYVFNDDGSLDRIVEGFVTDENEKTKYYVDGIAQTGWQEINSATYYFSKKTANMITGEREIGGKLYVFNDDGSLDRIVEGFVTDENEKTKYYVDGIAQTGWQEIQGVTYYFSLKTQNMLTSYRMIGDICYDFLEDGMCIGYYTGYYNDGINVRYFVNGTMLKGWQTINGIKCYFKYYTGEMVKGWATVGGKQYYFKRNSKGEMATGIVVIDSKAHSFGTDGVYQGLYTGFAEIDEVTKYFDNGVMLTKWQTIGGYKYYFKAYTGEMVTGNTTIGGKLYHFAEDGKLIG